MSSPKKIVIIGGVAGGMSAATRLRRLDPDASIIVIERSGFVSYANCGLPYFMGGVIQSQGALLLQTPESLKDRFALDVRINATATTINRAQQAIHIENRAGNSYDLDYDYLILSPGAQPVVPPIPGTERAHTLRTVEDVTKITAAVNAQPGSAVVVGGGFIGVESAENLVHRGIATTIIEAGQQLLAPLDAELAALVHEEMRSQGVTVELGVQVTEITDDAITLSDGRSLSAELVIAAIGVRPDTSLAFGSGIEVGTRGGIVVNEYGQTSDPHIYAIGDVAEKIDALDGNPTLVPLANIANRQGRVVADHIMGQRIRPVKTIGTAIVKVFDLTVATTGWNEKRARAQGLSTFIIHTHPGSHAGYYPGAEQMALKLLVDKNTNLIVGAQAVGKDGVDKRIDVLATAIRSGMTAPELADLELAYAPPFGSAKDPVNMLGYIADNMIAGLTETAQWYEVEQFEQQGYIIVDVRTQTEFEADAIPGSLNIPLDDLRFRLDELAQRPVLVYCQVGQRGHSATVFLREEGFQAVNLDGGFQTWSAITQDQAHFTNREEIYV